MTFKNHDKAANLQDDVLSLSDDDEIERAPS